MSSKNKRMASRQSRIRERRRRGGGRARVTPAMPDSAAAGGEIRRSATARAAGEALSVDAAASSGAPVSARGGVSAAADVQAAATARRRVARRVPSEPLAMYAHLGSELRRIGALTALMAVALAVLTVFMR